jgi:toxin ParE1/3/4
MPPGAVSRVRSCGPGIPRTPYREVTVSPYRFFYRLKETTVWVVAVWHGAQLPTEPQE